MSNYETVHRESIENPEEFWARAAKGIVWDHPYEKVLDETHAPFYRWFVGGRLNTCYNALDRHVDEGRGDAVALIYDSPVTGTVASFTYSDLRNRVARFAGALRSLGLGRGDTAIIYMPMIPETVIAMLACARLGAVHSVVFGGFAPPELAVRIDHAKPKLLLTASGAFEGTKTLAYKPLVDSALDLATHKPDHCVVFQRPGIVAELVVPRDVDWNTALEVATDADCVPV